MNGRWMTFKGMENEEALQSLQGAEHDMVSNISMIDAIYVAGEQALAQFMCKQGLYYRYSHWFSKKIRTWSRRYTKL